MDSEENMDLALNSNFDSLLDCWDEEATDIGGDDRGGNEDAESSTSEIEPGKPAAWDKPEFSRDSRFDRLPSFTMEQDGEDQYRRSMTSSLEDKQELGAPSPAALGDAASDITCSRRTAVSVDDASTTTASNAGGIGPSSRIGAAAGFHISPETSTQLHPLAIQASAKCPPHETYVASSSGAGAPHASSALQSVFDMQNSALLPLAMNALAAGATLPYSFMIQTTGGVGVADDNTRDVLAPKPFPPTIMHSNRSAQQAVSAPQLSVPPFFLFDAPVELRTNFHQSQRAHGLPVLYDNNAYHFGIAVNGFHPQSLHQSQNIRLVDARHGDIGEKRIKNAKEQKRAQRIAELIDELRNEMEKGGWKVGHKSKFNTLSSCATYVKHLVKVTIEKEKAVQQARCDLEAKRSKMEDDKAQQEPSDPESTTSSLTVSSDSAAGGAVVSEGQGSSSKGGNKRHASEGMESGNPKKPRLETHESSLSSASSGGDDSGKRPVQSLAKDQTPSTVSDMTESNKGSLTNNDPVPSKPCASDAAVADGRKRGNSEIGDLGTLLVQKQTLQPSLDLASLALDFEIDYEEVFVKSNVPQCLATTAGKIISWNEFFQKATGLSEKRMESATIFSLVRTSKLSNLFEIVAKSLRSADPQTGNGATKEVNYEAMTLPCIKFPTDGPSQLYITVTLMPDEDPSKRCFHCLLTDCPCTNGEIGPISPELLATLFKPHHQKPEKKKGSKMPTTGSKAISIDDSIRV